MDDEVKKDDWATAFAEDMAATAIDEEIAHHPELFPQRETLLRGHVLRNKKMILSQFEEFYKQSSAGTEAIAEGLKNATPVEKERMEGEFKRASEIFLFKEKEILPEENGPMILQHSVGISNETVNWLYILAFTLQNRGETAQAIGVFKFITLLNPIVSDFWVGLGLSLLSIDKVEEALLNLNMALEVDPENATAFYFLSHCYKLAGDPGKAVEMLQQAENLALKEGSNADLIESIKVLKESFDEELGGQNVS